MLNDNYHYWHDHNNEYHHVHAANIHDNYLGTVYHNLAARIVHDGPVDTCAALHRVEGLDSTGGRSPASVGLTDGLPGTG